ncbi:unnamed protein product [Discosporangium mesarthrocarpum]
MGSRKYSTPVDMWSIGCIFAEMATGRPLLTGTSEGDQLVRVFHQLGTPTEAIYPGLTTLPNYQVSLGIGISSREGSSRVRRHISFHGVAHYFRLVCLLTRSGLGLGLGLRLRLGIGLSSPLLVAGVGNPRSSPATLWMCHPWQHVHARVWSGPRALCVGEVH